MYHETLIWDGWQLDVLVQCVDVVRIIMDATYQ